MDERANGKDAFFQAAFDAAPDGIAVFNDSGAYVYVNRAAAAIYSMSLAELRQRRIGDFTIGGDQSQLDAWWKALREQRELEGRHRFTSADGNERFVSFRTRADFLPGHHITIFREQAGPRLRLSRREREVMQKLAEGQKGTAIASELFISPETVRTHVRNAMDKLGARTRAHAIALAAAYGEIDFPEG
jgi:PAS domain S-box-containing protein